MLHHTTHVGPDHNAELQRVRQEYRPSLPLALHSLPLAAKAFSAADAEPLLAKLVDSEKQEALKELFPETFDSSLVRLVPAPRSDGLHPPLRVGIVLSGGQAPGGHNVICGLYDYVKAVNPESQIFGFLNGPKGIFTCNYKQLDDASLATVRNMGGFDYLGSGRDKIEKEEHLAASVEAARRLDLQGLVVVGGDDSNTNAALLAEYFKKNDCQTKVIGVPKTIDGDLKNAVVETSFGYDTACRLYSELIGNLCMDAATSNEMYHFVRLMGRSASHITLECALATRPNLTFVGEEVARDSRTLKSLAVEVTDMVEARRAKGKTAGVILLPEGLVEFVPEMGALIAELNECGDPAKLAEKNLAVWSVLPRQIQEQLLLDRDPHGNVQVAKIATEQLLILMVEEELLARGHVKKDLEMWFRPTAHYFGYEGRCGMPSNFDANYCYGLGYNAGALVDAGLTGYMSVLQDLHKSVYEWVPAGCPLTKMMTLERRHGKQKPVIRKYLTELDGACFRAFAEVREQWKTLDCYAQPGPLQFDRLQHSYMITPPAAGDLLPAGHSRRAWMSPVQRQRLSHVPEVPALLEGPSRVSRTMRLPAQEQQLGKALRAEYGHIIRGEMHCLAASTEKEKPLRAGVVFLGQQAPGAENVVWGMAKRLAQTPGSKLIGFYGAEGLVSGHYTEITESSLELHRNQGGLTLLGRNGGWGTDLEVMGLEKNLEKVYQLVEKQLQLDALIVVGGTYTFTDSALLAEFLLRHESACRVVTVPATVNNNIRHPSIEVTVGFDTASRTYASLIGNLLTDAASAKKYWYFVRLMGRDPSFTVLEAALQTNPNAIVVSENCAQEGQDLKDVVANVASLVERRAAAGKNWGVVVLPEGLLSFLPTSKALLREVQRGGELSPWAEAFLAGLPSGFRKQLYDAVSETGRIKLSLLKTEEVLSEMVGRELKQRPDYVGSFSPVCHYFGHVGQSALPSDFDCALGKTHGMLAVAAAQSGLTGVTTTIQGLCGRPSEWRCGALPLTALMSVMATPHPGYGRVLPTVPSTTVDIHCKAFRTIRALVEEWETMDAFSNPGPIQFAGQTSLRPRILTEEYGEYLELQKRLAAALQYVHDSCAFGASELLVKNAVTHVEALCDTIDNSVADPHSSYLKSYLAAAVTMQTDTC